MAAPGRQEARRARGLEDAPSVSAVGPGQDGEAELLAPKLSAQRSPPRDDGPSEGPCRLLDTDGNANEGRH